LVTSAANAATSSPSMSKWKRTGLNPTPSEDGISSVRRRPSALSVM
jgi:hypothetical protein